MKILHYFLGFPPYRSGGLTKYAVDLMDGQSDDGNKIYALWPGKIDFILKAVKIQPRKSIRNILSYELINPLPIPLDEGINDINLYTRNCDIKIYRDFLEMIDPDVIHIHTLMGLHKEFIEAAVSLKIRTVFTTHDYFGICPKVTLYRDDGHTCDDDHGCADCIQCNATALSLRKIKLMQHPIYRILKNTPFFRYIREKHRMSFFEGRSRQKSVPLSRDICPDGYRELRTYYLGSLKKMDFIHFNSSLAERIYKRYFIPKDSRVVSITHRDISDNRDINIWKYKESLSITYLAPSRSAKGFDVLRSALDELWAEGYFKFGLNVYSAVDDPPPYMQVHKNGFTHNELAAIFLETDILAAPSVCYETFGFTVLEALSYGVPVIVSDHVGSKDIIGQGGILVEAGNVGELKKIICDLSKEKQERLRACIKKNVTIKTWGTLQDETYQMYVNV